MTCTTRKANFIECDSLNCKNMKCQNKFISGRGNYKLIITKQGSQGMGVKLGQNDRIDENIFIGEYTGQVRSRSAVEKNSSYSAKLSKNHVVDAKDSTKILKYLNHSCFPNARLEVWLSEGKLFMSIFYMKIKLTNFILLIVDGFPRICLFSTRTIYANEWITISYGKYAREMFHEQKCTCEICD